MKLPEIWSELSAHGAFAVAVAQEDKSLEEHAKFYANFGDDRPFAIVADLEGVTLESYRRTTTYLIDRSGIVREIFPGSVRLRPSWLAIRNRFAEIEAERGEKK
ncbi:MAG: hypothetical protein RL885_24045 [Planctomycetota bacterium]